MRLKIEDLKVQSFVTGKVKGGDCSHTVLCPTQIFCTDYTQDGTGCCPTDDSCNWNCKEQKA